MKRIFLAAFVLFANMSGAHADEMCAAHAGWLVKHLEDYNRLEDRAQREKEEIFFRELSRMREFDIPNAWSHVKESCASEQIKWFFTEGPFPESTRKRHSLR